MIFRNKYWSESKLADWIRTTFGRYEKPTAMTFEDWDNWESTMSTKHFIVFWITEKFLDIVQNIVMYPADIWDNIRCYIRNRFFDRMHVLDTKLPRGQFFEYDTRILHALFEEFIDFIECEKAWMMVVFNKDKYKEYRFPSLLKYRPFRFYTFRCPQAGLDYLKWEMSLVWNKDMGIEADNEHYNQPTHQAISAKEQYELYNWWKNSRPQRPDVWKSGFDGDPRIEEQRQYEEDTEMLIRLIKIRQELWT